MHIFSRVCLLAAATCWQQAVVVEGIAAPNRHVTGPPNSDTGLREVFLGNEYIELGVDPSGKHEALDSLPPGFFGRIPGDGIGMVVDVDGFGNGTDLRCGVFRPGAPEERFTFGYIDESGAEHQAHNFATDVVDTTVPGSGEVSAAVMAELDGVQLKIETFLRAGKHHYRTEVTVTNSRPFPGSITKVRFMRSFDPDNTVDYGGSHTTWQRQRATYADDGYSLVTAESQDNDAYYRAAGAPLLVGFYSLDERTRGSWDTIFIPRGVFDPRVWDTPAPRGSQYLGDTYIAMTTDFGDMPFGAVESTTFYTILTIDLESIVQDIIEEEETVNGFNCESECRRGGPAEGVYKLETIPDPFFMLDEPGCRAYSCCCYKDHDKRDIYHQQVCFCAGSAA